MDLMKPGWLGLVVSGVGQCHLGAVPLNCRAFCLKTFGYSLIVLQQHVGESSWPCWQEGEGSRNLSGLRLTWILLCSLLLARLGPEHPFTGSRGKSLFLAHLRQLGHFLG